MKRRVAILISGRGSNMSALIKAARNSSFPAEIVLVISNKTDAGGLAEAAKSGIAIRTIESKSFRGDREAFERQLQKELTNNRIELICLAGFMRVLTAWFVTQWEGRMINIHPALLPAFPGLHTHEQALAAGVKIHGATVHFVVKDVDAGPIIMQGAVAVRDDDTEDTLAVRVLDVEHRIYPDALRLVAEGAVTIEGTVCRTKAAAGSPDDALIVPSVI